MFKKKKEQPKEKSLVEIKQEAEANLFRLAEEMSTAWEEANLAGSRLMPWISWPQKEIQIVTRSTPKKVESTD